MNVPLRTRVAVFGALIWAAAIARA
ncbi:MAG: hypothetical protein JWN51_141, partial [Phycisphaerales bacterium]|nr:hypothetical protein [Phycisphaerales bacterium]